MPDETLFGLDPSQVTVVDASRWPRLGTIPDGQACVHCQTGLATTHWVGDVGGLALSHGFYEYWCDRCMVTAQLEAARASAARIGDLEKRLASLDEAEQVVEHGA